MYNDQVLIATLENGRCALTINLLILFMVAHLHVMIWSHKQFYFFLVYLNDNYEVAVPANNGQAQTRLQHNPSPDWHEGLSRWIWNVLTDAGTRHQLGGHYKHAPTVFPSVAITYLGLWRKWPVLIKMNPWTMAGVWYKSIP